jgi:hypothetical protein
MWKWGKWVVEIQQLQEQQCSLEAVDEALAADPSNADLLDVRRNITSLFFKL